VAPPTAPPKRKQRGVAPLAETLREPLRAAIGDQRIEDYADSIGTSENVIVRALAGLPIRKSSARVIEVALGLHAKKAA
jgi:hypothetical protein